MTSSQSAQPPRTWPNTPFPRPTREELDNFENQIRIHLNAIQAVQRLNARFPETNATPAQFPVWLSELDNWVRSAADLLERIRSARGFLERYESNFDGCDEEMRAR